MVATVTRLALISDSHFDHSSRFEECVAIHDWIAEDIAKRGVDLILHGGDLFERKSVPEDRNAAAAWMQKLANVAPVVIVYGNHDARSDLFLLGELETINKIYVVDRPQVVPAGGVLVACMPWPRRKPIATAAGRELSLEGSAQAAHECMQVVLGSLADQMDADAESHARVPRVFLGHVMLRGASVAPGQPIAPGADFELGTEDLALVRADLYALGHIHMRQSAIAGGAPVMYPGSPRSCDFGEPGDKTYAIIDFAGSSPSITYVPTPARKMLLLEAPWVPKLKAFLESPVSWPLGHMRDAEVRFRYSVDAEHREEAKREAALIRDRWLADEGVHSVRVEEQVETTTRARAPEVAAARTLPEKLDAMYRSQGREPEPAVRDRLFQKLAILEEEARQ